MLSTKFEVGFISLGCDKNRVDTEKMLYTLVSSGDYVLTQDLSNAKIIVVNTCAFIESAREEAIKTILEMAEYKETGACRKLIVTGCFSQKYASEAAVDLPEVDAFLGTADYGSILSVINTLLGDEQAQVILTDKKDDTTNYSPRILTTPTHYAYLMIADGCNNHCTYCIIPSIRGKLVSKKQDQILLEAKGLIDSGVQEIILVAQDLTAYGLDLYKKPMLVPLLKELVKLAVCKIRLMYCYPQGITDELIDLIATSSKIAKYIDIPLQHTDDKILSLMKRRTTNKDIASLFDKIKKANKDIAIRTTVMVGFPQETELEFNNLYNFIKKYKPTHTGIFSYSKEGGTVAAKLKGQVSKVAKNKRHKKLAQLHLENVVKYNKSQIGKTLAVVYEGIDFDKNLFYGRTEHNAPDIDTLVYFSGKKAELGETYKVKITDYKDYDLIGKVVESGVDKYVV